MFFKTNNFLDVQFQGIKNRNIRLGKSQLCFLNENDFLLYFRIYLKKLIFLTTFYKIKFPRYFSKDERLIRLVKAGTTIDPVVKENRRLIRPVKENQQLIWPLKTKPTINPTSESKTIDSVSESKTDD